MNKHPFRYPGETLEALKGSIRKWEGIAYHGQISSGNIDCPLCNLFNRDGLSGGTKKYSSDPCKGCPIYTETGELFCGGTPHDRYISTDGTDRIKAAESFLHWLQNLYDKLTSGRKEIAATGKDLTVSVLAGEIDWYNEDEVNLLFAFQQWVKKNKYIGPILLRESTSFGRTFSPQYPEFEDLLIKYGFARRVKKESKKPEFEPFSIEVKTLEEAQELWHRVNLSIKVIKMHVDDADTKRIPFSEIDCLRQIWDEVDEQLIEQGFKK